MLFVFSLSSACTDQGCIEADDFGEYQTQTLEIPTNATEDSCNYDPSLDLTDADQGSGIKACLISGAKTIADEAGNYQYTTSGGCSGYQTNSSGSYIDNYGNVTTDSSKYIKMDSIHQNFCVSKCRTLCLDGSSSVGGVTNPEPNWVATDARDSSMNAGVQILPGSKISVTATGSVTLSNSANYYPIYIPVDTLDNNGIHQFYQDSTWSIYSLFDVTSGQTFNASFSGMWTRPTDDNAYYANSANVGGGSNSLAPNSSWNSAVYNGARTLVAYTVKHPDGYIFDTSKTSESAGSTGTPIIPRVKSWTCDYDSTKIYNSNSATTAPYLLDSNCHLIPGTYTMLGYSPSVDVAVAKNPDFAITSAAKTAALGFYGGPIRWTDDGVLDASNPIFTNGYAKDFTTISSTEYAISAGASNPITTKIPSVPGSASLTFPSEGLTFSNNDNVSYMVFVSSNVSSCSGSVLATIKNYSGAIIKDSVALPLLLKDWNTTTASRLTIDPGQKILIVASGGCKDQGALSVKFQKFQDIQITKSGFLRFTTLNASSGTCTLNARIINPKDSSGNIRTNDDPDFYEYDDFDATTSIDPFENLSVPTSNLTTQTWSNSVFVRKGQTIRFSPISWNGNVQVNSNSTPPTIITRQCGTGMVIRLLPFRPALLCKGFSNESISNPDKRCLPDIDLSTGLLIGCQAYASECSDASNSSNYCPYTACQSTISCTPGTSSNNYTKTSCTTTSNVDSAACVTALSGLSSSNQEYFKTACGPSNCSAKMLANARLSAMSNHGLDTCWDLENYTGRVASIPTATGNIIDNTSNPEIFSKGAAKLGIFNGYYGNFEKFSDTGNIDASANNNKIYQATNMMTFAQNSRLKFMFVTNNGDFRNLDTVYSTLKPPSSGTYTYSNLSNRGSSYNGSNGFKVSFSGTLQFSNGQWLEAKLCREDAANSCRSFNVSSAITDGQPNLVEINTPVSLTDNTPVLSSTANYKFDAFGVLTRITAPGTKDCNIASQAVDTQIDSNFYCHTYLDATHLYIYDSTKAAPFSDSDYTELNKLRLTFKIKDPELPNCKIRCTKSITGTKLDGYLGTDGSCSDTAPSSDTGVKMSNPAYQTGTCSGVTSGVDALMCGYDDANNAINTDGIPSVTATSPCCKQYYCTSRYANNSGKYYVTVKVANPPGSSISNIIGGVITPVINVMDGTRTIAADGTVTKTVGQSERIYNLVVGDSRYQAILTMAMSMMIMFYGVTYLMGVIDMTSSDLINRGIKISLIYFFASPTGWYWFNLFAVKWFKDGTDYLAFMMASSFDDSATLAKAISLNDYYDKSVLFSSVDKVFGMFFSQAVQKKISALLFASLFGIVYLWIIYLSFMLYIYAVGYAILYYLTAQIFISILFTLGPIFFIFTLFNQTKGMFDAWLKQLIGFSLQQIFLLTTLAFFNMMMYEVLKMSLGYKICWDEVWTINIITRISLLSFWTISSLPPSVNTQSEVGDIGHPEGIPSLFSILFIWVVASLMQNFISFMTNLGASIGGSLKASEMASGVLSTVSSIHKTATKNFDDISKATIGEPMKRLDAALFDSGEYADKARTERENKNRQDQSKKASLSKAGNEAMSRFKIENASKYATMSESERKEALITARNKGMEAEAKKLGISDKELADLKKDKGLKYEGSNLLIAAAQASRQKLGFGGGTLSKSINDSKIDSKMAYDEASKGMSKMSKEDRDDFEKKVEEGKVAVDKSLSQKVIGTAQIAAAVVASPAIATAAVTLDSGSALLNTISRGKHGNKDFEATSAVGKKAYKVAGSAKDSLARASKKVMGKTANVAGFGEYNEARKRLEERGKITIMASNKILGTNFARSKEEKQMIRDEMKAHRESKKIEAPMANNSVTIKKLSSLNKGLTKDENNKSTATAISSAIFGAGGLRHAINTQGEKLSSTNNINIKARSTAGIASDFKLRDELATSRAQLAQAKITKEHAQKAASVIKQMQELEKEKSSTTNPDQIKVIDARIAQLKEDDKARRDDKGNILAGGGSGYFENAERMSALREQYKAEKDPAKQKSISDQMTAITSSGGYIESEGGGLNKANAIYQSADQESKRLGGKNYDGKGGRVGALESISNSMQQSSSIYNAIIGSDIAVEAAKAKEAYDNIGAWNKMTGGGLFSKNENDVKAINNFKRIQPTYEKIQAIKEDYGKLSDLSNQDIQLQSSGKFKDSSKAATRHNEFSQKYNTTLEEINKTTATASGLSGGVPSNALVATSDSSNSSVATRSDALTTTDDDISTITSSVETNDIDDRY